MRFRHKNCESVTGIEEVSENEWVVPSASDSRKYYKVCQVSSVPCECKLICNICSVCVHMYTCNCPDFLIGNLSCKHIHAVHTAKKKVKSSTPNDDIKFDSRKENEALNMFKSFLKTIDKNTFQSNDNDRIRMLALQKTKSIIKLLKTSNDRKTLTGIFDGLKNTYLIGCGLKKNENAKK